MRINLEKCFYRAFISVHLWLKKRFKHGYYLIGLSKIGFRQPCAQRSRSSRMKIISCVGTRSLTGSDRDRYTYDRKEILEQSLEAWRTNPLARRIVELTSQYVVGGGFTINCKHDSAAAFFDSFWNHRLNHMPVRVSELCDELTRTGNLVHPAFN